MLGCSPQTVDLKPKSIKKINGVSVVASRFPISKEHIDPILNVNSNYATIMPFGFIKDIMNPNLSFNSEDHWFGETKEGVKQYVNELKKEDFKIMLKPQIWVWRGDFTGNIKMESELNWTIFEDSYSQFILEFAELAEDLHVELFCIGTELELFIEHRPDYWFYLIDQIKKVYTGKLTYASNWNEYEKVPFWRNLDFIGIDAYFPISNSKTPSVEDCRQGWLNDKNSIRRVSIDMDKPVLFTEFGYRSVDFTGKEPWRSDKIVDNVNLSGQLFALQAIFDEFWNEEWFAGGFVWKWHLDHKNAGGSSNNRFTPQNKPAEDILKDNYSLYP